MSIFDYGWYVIEHFSSNTSITDGAVGDKLWDIDAISGGADTLTIEGAAGETFLRMTGGGAGDGDGTALGLSVDDWTVNQYGGFMRTRVRIPDITGNAIAANNFRIGFSDVRDSSEPVVGMWIDCDGGVISFDSASANGDVSTAASASKLTSSTTLVLGTTYDMELKWSGNNGNANPGPDTLELWIGGQLAGKQAGTVLLDGAETFEPTITHWCDTGGASTLELDVFGFEAGSYRAK